MKPLPPVPSPQPFLCPVKDCNLSFQTGKALDTHVHERHEPDWNAYDRDLMRAFRIKLD